MDDLVSRLVTRLMIVRQQLGEDVYKIAAERALNAIGRVAHETAEVRARRMERPSAKVLKFRRRPAPD